MPAFGTAVAGGSPYRLAWRTTSWFDSTQVLGAPTPVNAAIDSSMTERSSSGFHGVPR